jgi:hypothetical protein
MPLLIAPILLCAAVAMDVSQVKCGLKEPCNWIMRCGALTTVLGGYVAFRAAKTLLAVVGEKENRMMRGFNSDLPYSWISAVLLVCGAIIWGFGDLLTARLLQQQ